MNKCVENVTCYNETYWILFQNEESGLNVMNRRSFNSSVNIMYVDPDFYNDVTLINSTVDL